MRQARLHLATYTEPHFPIAVASVMTPSRVQAAGRHRLGLFSLCFFFQAEDGIRDYKVTGVQTCALPISFMAAFAAERLGAQRVSIFFVNDEYGAGLRDGVRAELQQRRVTVLDEVGFGTESDYAALVGASLRRGRPDVILIAGRAADSIYVVACWLPDAPDSLSRAFVERFRRIAGRVPQSSDAMSHDALLLLAAAVRDVGPSRVAIRDYLRALGPERAPYPGVTGPISFRPATTRSTGP